MDDVEDVYKNKKTRILLASVRITDNNLLTRLNDYFALTREFYYGKILYTDKQKYTIRVIRDLNKTKPSIIPKQITFSTYETNVEILSVDQIPIAEVYKDITRNDIVKVPNYETAQEFIKIVGNVVTFKTDEGTFDTANIMDALVVHGQTKYLFYPSSFLFQWWKKNKKDILKKIKAEKERKAENAKQREEERLAALAAEEERKKAEAEAERAKQQAAEEERKRREAEEATKKRLKNKRKKTQKTQQQRRSSRLKEGEKKQPRRNPSRKARQLHEEYTEKLKL